ncbi:hypothetical protein K438DRAFT_1958113 [Mycena galopus ATCC 62051]|nr:hypothetical protein K438DRAFT_1958113 [Mycena galopus ATCC 62051]
MAPISTGFSAYPTPAAFFEPFPGSTFGFAPSPTFSIGQAVDAGAAAHDPGYVSASTPPPSFVTQAASPDNNPDIGLHRFLVYMAILGAVCFGCMAYILAKPYLSKWCGGKADDKDDEEKQRPGLGLASASFRAPAMALPPRSATYGRADIWIPQERPAVVPSLSSICISVNIGFGTS